MPTEMPAAKCCACNGTPPANASATRRAIASQVGASALIQIANSSPAMRHIGTRGTHTSRSHSAAAASTLSPCA